MENLYSKHAMVEFGHVTPSEITYADFKRRKNARVPKSIIPESSTCTENILLVFVDYFTYVNMNAILSKIFFQFTNIYIKFKSFRNDFSSYVTREFHKIISR